MLILVNGKKRAGKDYFSSLLLNELNKNVTCTTMSFATPLKEIIAGAFKISIDELDALKNSDYSFMYNQFNDFQEITFREILQNFGTESMKAVFGGDVWVKLLISKYKEYTKETGDIVIVPDFRFKCEHISDSYTINIVNDDINNTDSHASENELNSYKFDYYVDNTGKPNLHNDVVNVAHDILNKFKTLHSVT